VSRLIAIAFGVLTIVLVAVGTLFPARTDVSVMYISGEGTGATQSDKTPEAAVLSVYDNVRQRQFHDAYQYVANANQVDEKEFTDDVRGTNGSLRTYSNLETTDVKVLHASDSQATVRATTKWATAVGPYYETRDYDVVNKGGLWKVNWPENTDSKVPPQVIPVNYLRWDVVWRGAGDDWGSQNVEAPHVRLISMKALQHGTATVVVGEILIQCHFMPGANVSMRRARPATWEMARTASEPPSTTGTPTMPSLPTVATSTMAPSSSGVTSEITPSSGK